MKENNPVTVAEETKRLEENPISPPTAPVVTTTEQSAVPTPNVPTAPIVENVAKEEVSVGWTPPAPVTPVPTPATPTDYKWDASTNSYKEVAKATATPQTTTATPTEAKVPGTDVLEGTGKTQAEFDKFVGREKEVLTNLNEAYASWIKDGDGIRKFASYDTATPEKKAAIDAFILSKRKEEEGISSGSQFGSEDGIYGALVNNVMVPPSVKNSPAYKSAEARYKKYKFLTSASTDTLKELIKNGKLVPGTKTYNDFYNTPTGKANIDKANKLLSISGGSVDTGKAGQNMTKEVLTWNATIAKALEDGEITGEELNSLTSSPELVAKGKELAAKKLEIDKLQLAKKGIKEDIDKQYGAKLTASQRAAVINNRIRDIDRSLDTLLLEYNSEFGQYSQEKEQKLALFNTNLALYKDAKKAEADKLAKIEEREYEDEKEKSKRIYDSVNAQIKFALENGVDLKRTDANVVIDDAKRYAEANGVSIEQAINETFTTPLTAKPSYARALQAIYDKNSGALTPYQKAQLAQGDREFALSMAKFGFEKDKLDAETNKGYEPKWGILGTNRNWDTVYGWIPAPTPTTTSPATDTNISAIDFIKSKEGFREKAYKDSGGVWTIGYGFTTRADWSPVREWDTMDEQTADELIEKKVATYQNWRDKVTVNLNPSQEAALTSFEYNLGRNIWKGDAKPIIDKINSGDFAWAAEYLKKFNTVKGTVVRGLTNRRNEEASMIMSSVPSTNGGMSSLDIALDKPVIRPEVVAQKGYDPSIVDVYKRINTGKSIPETERRSLGIDANTLSREARAYGKELDKQGLPSVEKLISQLKEIRNASKWDRVLSKWGLVGELASEGASNFAATYNNIIAKTALKELIDLKNEGATFGALSNQELNFITDASDTGVLKVSLSQPEWERKIDSVIAETERLRSKIQSGADFLPPTGTPSASVTPTSWMGAVDRLKYLRSQTWNK